MYFKWISASGHSFEHLAFTLCVESISLTFCSGPGLSQTDWLRTVSSQLITATHLLSWGWNLPLPYLLITRKGPPNLKHPSHSLEAEYSCYPETLVPTLPSCLGPKTNSSPYYQPSFAFMDMVVWTLAPPKKGINSFFTLSHLLTRSS